jgi:uncharacterized protein YfaS (alpha-2-macroglobulin family)
MIANRIVGNILCAIVALACVVAMLRSQPAIGTVTGLLTDRDTGKPIIGAVVTITPYSGAVHDDDFDQAATVPPDEQPPTGWSEDESDDGATDTDGNAIDNKPEYRAHTDSHGRFVLPHVPTGEYTLNTYTSGHSDKDHVILVPEGRIIDIPLALVRNRPSLMFDTQSQQVAANKIPSLAISGLLTVTSFSVAISTVDVEGALASNPFSMPFNESSAQPDKRFSHLLRQFDVPVKDADDEGSFSQRVSLGSLPPGLYHVEASVRDSGVTLSNSTWLNVSSIVEVRKAYPGHVLTFVADSLSGKPVPARIRYWEQANKQHKLVADTVSSADGRYLLATAGPGIPAPDPESTGVLVATYQGSVVLTSISLNSPGDEKQNGGATVVTGAAEIRSFVLSDRPVYRPGQTVHLKGINRRYTVAAGYSVPLSKSAVITKTTVPLNDFGSWNTDVTLSDDALTGEYSVSAIVDGKETDGSFQIAAYQKPLCEVTITFAKSRYIRGDTVSATIDGHYYFGAPLAGASANVTGTFGDVVASDDDSSDDDSDSSGTQPSGAQSFNKTVTLDPNGRAVVEIPTSTDTLGVGDQSMTVNASVTEPGNGEVSGSASVTVAQGLFSLQTTTDLSVATPGSTVHARAVATDQGSKPMAGLPLDLTADYETWQNGNETTTPVLKAHVKTGADGSIDEPVPAAKPGLLEITYQGTDSRGNKVLSTSEVWVPGESSDIPARYSDLTVVLDRKTYQPGQTANLLINTSHTGGDALVTIEGSTLYRSFVIPLARRSTSVSIPVTKDLVPGVTIGVCTVAANQFYNSEVPLATPAADQTLVIGIVPDQNRYHPGDTAGLTITTRDASGKPVRADVCFGVVDKSIYAIVPDRTDTILQAFVPDQQNSVDTASSCDQVYYGDVDKEGVSVSVRKNFADTACWSANLDTGPSGHRHVLFKLPDNLATWRVTAYGDTLDTHVGRATADFICNKDMMVRMVMPSYIVAGDTAKISEVVQNTTATSMTAHVTCTAQNGLSLSGNEAQNITVPANGNQTLTWDLTASSAGSGGTIVATAVAGKLSDGVSTPVTVEPHGTVTSQWFSGSLQHDVSHTFAVAPNLITEASSVRIRLAPSIAPALPAALDYLAAYPYDCTDATSATLIGNTVVRDAQKSGAITINAPDLDDQIRRSIVRLENLETSDNGWNWFAHGNPDLWMTSFATWSLARSKASGAMVAAELLAATAKETADLANAEIASFGPKHYADLSGLAQAALALSAAGGNDGTVIAILHALDHQWAAHPDQCETTDMAAAAIAANSIAGPGKTWASLAMNRLWIGSYDLGSAKAWPDTPHYQSLGATQDVPSLSATAWAVLAAETIAPGDPRIEQGVRWLMDNRTGSYWQCPRDTAVTLLALAKYVESTHELSPNFTATVLLNGKSVGTHAFTTTSLGAPDFVVDCAGSQLKPGQNTVEVRVNGTGKCYYSAQVSQCIPEPQPPAPLSLLSRAYLRIFHPDQLEPKFSASGFSVKRVYTRLTSRRSFFWEDSTPTPDTDYRTDEVAMVRLIIYCRRPAAHVIISDPAPAGFTISDVSTEDAEDWDNWWDETDVRDDRVVFFATNMTRGEHEIDYHLHAQYPGAFDVMGTSLSGAFDPTVSAHGSAAHLTISEGNNFETGISGS